MEDIDKEFVNNVKEGDIMVANKNFGCGSSREHAPISIKASGHGETEFIQSEPPEHPYQDRTRKGDQEGFRPEGQ